MARLSVVLLSAYWCSWLIKKYRSPTIKNGSEKMKRQVLIEGSLLLLIGLVSFAEGFRLISGRNPQDGYDILGPGFYLVVLSIPLIAVALMHIISSYKGKSDLIRKGMLYNEEMKVLYIVLILVLYTFLISIIGYSAASFVFFLTLLRLFGVKLWRNNLMLAISLTAGFVIIFIYFCNMTFPKGIF
jgi:hypothetical protein